MKNEALTSKRRLAQIISILHKHQITRGIDPVKLREIIEDLGPTFVKIGQLMSSRASTWAMTAILIIFSFSLITVSPRLQTVYIIYLKVDKYNEISS